MGRKYSSADNSKKLEKAIRSSAREILPDFLKNSDIQILMPLEATLMRSDFSRVQLSVLLSIIEKLAYKIREVVDKRKNMGAGEELSLFDENEFLLNEKDEKVFRIKLHYKDVGVSKSHYEELESSIKALAGLPISLPFRGKDGREYQRFTNFCDVYVPMGQKKNIYCIVELKQDVAQCLLKVDFGYHYVGKHASNFFGKCSKYCERIYWLIQGYQNIGHVTVPAAEFRKRYGLEKSYRNFNSIRTKILDVSRDEIKKVFMLRGCDCWFTYELIYDGRKRKGEPDEIKFTIHRESPVVEDKEFVDKQLRAEELAGGAEFTDILRKDLHVGELAARRLAGLLTKENYQAAINKAISLKAELDSGREIKNPSRYILTSIGNFFAEFGEKAKGASTGNGNRGSAVWREMLMRYCRTADQTAVRETISLMRFGGYDAEKKTLTICFPDMETKNRMDEYGPSFSKAVKRHFGEDVRTQFTIEGKEVTDGV